MTRSEELENLITECCKASSIYYQGKQQAVKYLCGQGIIVFFESNRMLDPCEVNIPYYNAETDDKLIMRLIKESRIIEGCESHEYKGCHYCYTIMLKEERSDEKFDNYRWNAKCLKTIEDIIEQIASLGIIGRRIKGMRFIGLPFNLREEDIEDAAYNILDNGTMTHEEIRMHSEFSNIAPDLRFSRCVEFDEPLLIEFDDGDVLEILLPGEAQYQMSINQIRRDISSGYDNDVNVDANILFSPCLGKQIVGFQIDTSPLYWNIGESLSTSVTAEDMPNYLILWLNNGMGLRFWTEMGDYSKVCLIKGNHSDVKISFAEMKMALNFLDK